MNQSTRVFVFFMNLVASLIILYLIYNFFYLKYYKEYNSRTDVYNRFYNINIVLDDFTNIQTRMDEESKDIENIISEYEDTFCTNEQKINSYKDKIKDLLQEIEIPILDDTISQEEKEDKSIEFELNLRADYSQICKFLFELERYSAVSFISMDYLGNVKIKVKPILFSTPVNDSFYGRTSVDFIDDDIKRIGFFKEISDQIFEIKDVGYIQTWRDFEPIPKDPFYFYEPIRQTKVTNNTKKKKKLKPQLKVPPTIVLDGIMYEKINPVVIIDGKFYYTGSVYKNCKIIKINENSIDISYYGNIYNIKMNL